MSLPAPKPALPVAPACASGEFIAYGRQLIEDDDIAAVAAALKSDFLTAGPLVPRFEGALAQATGAHETVAVSNGTAALHLAVRALGLGPGMAAIVPSITFLATANVLRLEGADVVFADVDPDTGLMTPANVEEALARAHGADVRAILPVHLAGQPCDMEAIASIARARRIAVIEDSCHALGTTYTDSTGAARRAGDCVYSTMACFSFHPVKTLTTGEGGAIATNDARLAAALRRDRCHGMTRDAHAFVNPDSLDRSGAANPWSYEMPAPGLNYRLADFQCALGLSQLAKLDRFVERRRALAAEYDCWLADLHPAIRPLGRVPHAQPAWHLYVVLMDFAALGVSRASLVRRLRELGIGTQVHYYPVHRQPYYARRYGELRLPGADAYYARCLSLPLHAGMDSRDVQRVCAALVAALG